VIEVRELIKKYGSVTAVDRISFSVERGELFGLLGPNGAGKTTTISVLSTLRPGDGGHALVAGIDVARDPQGVRRHIGVVPQEIALYEDLNARENLHFWGRLYGLGGAGLKARVEEMLELVDLREHAKQRVSSFSGGMKRRLNLAAGLMHNPDVLFLDEPTVGIDAQARSRILELIKNMNKNGLTILYTTHYLEEAEQLCDRIGVIDRGRLVALGDKEDLLRQIGEEHTIEFRLDADLLPALQADAAGWDGVGEVSRRRGLAVLRVRDGAASLPLVQAWLTRRGLALDALEVERPNLESLYLNLTGRELRE
jgi:ABC-2 type transport system ATP-binding protein